MPPVSLSPVPDNPASPESSLSAEPAPAAQRVPWRWFVRLAAGVLLLLVLIWRRDYAPLQAALQNTPFWLLAASVVGYWGTQVLSAWKWQILLRARGVQVSLWDCCRWYLAGMFWNLWMPTNVGGDGARAWMSSRRCGGLSIAASSILVERLTGFIALLALAAAGLAFHATQTLPQAALQPLIIGSVIILLILVIGFVFLRALSARDIAFAPAQKLINRAGKLQSALEWYLRREQWPALAVSLVLSLVFQAAQVMLNVGLARAVGLSLPFVTFWWMVPLLAVASLLPVGIGGLGVREAAAVALLDGTGTASGTIIAWSLLWQATVWLASLPGVLVREKMNHQDTRSTKKNKSG